MACVLVVVAAGLAAPGIPKAMAMPAPAESAQAEAALVVSLGKEMKEYEPLLPGVVISTVGTLAGTVSVGDAGGMGWRTALKLIPGVGGLQPSLGLGYSGSGYGELGLGFSLETDGPVRRCRRTLGQDGENGPIRWTQADALCWNGSRLEAVKGAHGAAGTEYRPWMAPTVRVIGIGDSASAHSGFAVYTPDGRQTWYGVMQPQEWTLGSMQWAQVGGHRIPFAWHVTRVRDQRTGNEMRYRYEGEAVAGDGRITPEGLRLSAIEYGLNEEAGITVPTRQVRLVHRPVPEVLQAEDAQAFAADAWVHQGYVAGQAYTRRRVLTQVVMEVRDSAGGWSVVRQYLLGYEPVKLPYSWQRTVEYPQPDDPQQFPKEVDTGLLPDRVRLRSLRECEATIPAGADTAAYNVTRCFWPTRFEWSVLNDETPFTGEEWAHNDLDEMTPMPGYGWDGVSFYPLPPAKDLETTVYDRPAMQVVFDSDGDGDEDMLVMPERMNTDVVPLMFWEYWETDPDVHGPVATNVPAWSATPWTNRAGTVVPASGSIQVLADNYENLPPDAQFVARPPEEVRHGHRRAEQAAAGVWSMNYDGTGGMDVLVGEPVIELAGALIDSPWGMASKTTVGRHFSTEGCAYQLTYSQMKTCLRELPRSRADYTAHPGFMQGLKVLRLKRGTGGTGAGSGNPAVQFEQTSLNYRDGRPILWAQVLELDGDTLTDVMFCKADADYAAVAGQAIPMFYAPGMDPVNWVSGTLHYGMNVPGTGIDLSGGGVPVTVPETGERAPCHAKDGYLVLDLDGDGTQSLLHYTHPHAGKTAVSQLAPEVPQGVVDDPYPEDPNAPELQDYWSKLTQHMWANKPLGQRYYHAFTYQAGQGVREQATTLLVDEFMRWQQRAGNTTRRYSTHQARLAIDDDPAPLADELNSRVTDFGDPDTWMVGGGPSEMRTTGDINGDGLMDVVMVDLQQCYVMQQGLTDEDAPVPQAEACSFRSVHEWGRNLLEQTYEKLAVFVYLSRGDGSFELADEGTNLWDTDLGTQDTLAYKYVLEQMYGGTALSEVEIEGLSAQEISAIFNKAWTIATRATRGWRLEFANSLIGDANGDGLSDLGYIKAEFAANGGWLGDSMSGTYTLKPVWRLGRHGGGLSQVDVPMGLDIDELVPASAPTGWPGWQEHLVNLPTSWKTPGDSAAVTDVYEQQAYGLSARLMQLDVDEDGRPEVAFYDHVRGQFKLAALPMMDEPQPHLLTAVVDGLGARTELDYAPQWTLTMPSTPWTAADIDLPYPLSRRPSTAAAVAQLRTDTGQEDGDGPVYVTTHYLYGKTTADVRRGISLGIDRSMSQQSVNTPSGPVQRRRVTRYDVTPAYDESFKAYPLAGSVASETTMVWGGPGEAVSLSHSGQRHSAHAGKVGPTWSRRLDASTATTFEIGQDVPEGTQTSLFDCLVGAYDGATECVLGPQDSHQPLTASTTSLAYDPDHAGLVKTQIVESAGSTSVSEQTYVHLDPDNLPSPQPYVLGLAQTQWVAHEPSPGAGFTLRTVANQYDTHGLLKTSTVEPDQAEYRVKQGYEYDAFGNVQVHKIYAEGHPTNVTTYAYSASGAYPTRVTNALGQQTTTQWNEGCGAAERVTNPLGHTQVTGYDGFCRTKDSQLFHGEVPLTRKSRQIYLEGLPEWLEDSYPAALKAATRITTVSVVDTDPDDAYTAKDARVTTLANRLGQTLVNQTPGLGFDVYTQTRYDPLGRVEAMSPPTPLGEPPAGWTTTHYDGQGRVIEVTKPDGTQQTTQYARYRRTTTDELGHSGASEVNALGQVVTVLPPPDPDHPEQDLSMCYAYGAFGTLVEAWPCMPTAAKGPTTLQYDDYGRLIRSEDGQAGVRLTRYDALGRVDESEDALGQITKFKYDVLGRLAARTEHYELDGTPDATTAVWTYAEDTGVLTQAINGAGTVIEEPLLDEYHRPAGMTTTIHGRSYTQRLSYDAWGRVASQTYPSLSLLAPVHTATHYNTLDQIVGLNAQGETLWRPVTADAWGHLLEQHYGADATPTVIATATYQPLTGRLDEARTYQRTWQTPDLYADTLLEHFRYDWYDHGLIRMRIREPLTGHDQAQADQFHYTPRGDLDHWTTIGAQQTVTHHDLTTDGFGNVTDSPTGHYSYEQEKLQLIQGPLGNLGYTYDGNGRVERRTHAGGETVLRYNGLNQVRRIDSPGAHQVITYSAGGAKAYMLDESSGRETYYLGAYQEERGGELASKGVVIGRYALGPAHLTRIWQTDLSYTDQLGFTPPADHLGSTTLVTSRKGEIIDRRAYDPWGNERDPEDWNAFKAAPKDDAQTPITGYTGHHERKQFGATAAGLSGLVDMGARYYDPAALRFVQPDTIVPEVFDPQSWNRFAYVNNNPGNYFDPTGMAKQDYRIDADGHSILSGDRPDECLNGNCYKNSEGMEGPTGHAAGAPGGLDAGAHLLGGLRRIARLLGVAKLYQDAEAKAQAEADKQARKPVHPDCMACTKVPNPGPRDRKLNALWDLWGKLAELAPLIGLDYDQLPTGSFAEFATWYEFSGGRDFLNAAVDRSTLYQGLGRGGGFGLNMKGGGGGGVPPRMFGLGDKLSRAARALVNELPKDVKIIKVDSRGRWVVYQTTENRLRVRFDASEAVTKQPLHNYRNNTVRTNAALSKEGNVYVLEGRHRAVAAANGDAISPAVGGVEFKPGWLDYNFEFSSQIQQENGIPLKSMRNYGE